MSDTPKAMTVVERAEVAPQQMHPMASAMLAVLEKNPDPDTMRKLLDIQREWESDEARRAFNVALVALKGELPRIISHDAEVDFSTAKGRTHYTHTTLARVTDEVEPHLTRFGFSLVFLPRTDEKGAVSVTTRLVHARGHSIETTLSARPDDSGGKNAIQGVGSAITYLRRYGALALLGIATADMPDADDEPATKTPAVDTKRNLALVSALKRAGKTRADAESLVGKPADEWTDADAATVEEWADPPPSLAEVMQAIEASSSRQMLDAVTKHAKRLRGGDADAARAAWKARAEEVGR